MFYYIEVVLSKSKEILERANFSYHDILRLYYQTQMKYLKKLTSRTMKPHNVIFGASTCHVFLFLKLGSWHFRGLVDADE